MQKQKKPLYKNWRSYVAGGLVILGTAGYGLRDNELEKEPTFSQTRPHHIDLTGETISKSPKKREKNIEFHEIKTPFGKLYPTPADLGLEKEFEEVEEAKKQGKDNLGLYKKFAKKIFDIQAPNATPEEKQGFLDDAVNEIKVNFIYKWLDRQKTLNEKLGQAGVGHVTIGYSGSEGIVIEYSKARNANIGPEQLEELFIKLLRTTAEVYHEADTIYIKSPYGSTLDQFEATIKCDVIKKYTNDDELFENIKDKIAGNSQWGRPRWFIENQYGSNVSEEEFEELYSGQIPPTTIEKMNGLLSYLAEEEREQNEWSKKYPSWFPRWFPSSIVREEEIFELKNKFEEVVAGGADIFFSCGSEYASAGIIYSQPETEAEELRDLFIKVVRTAAEGLPNAGSFYIGGEEGRGYKIGRRNPYFLSTDAFSVTVESSDIKKYSNDLELFEEIKGNIRSRIRGGGKPQWLMEIELGKKLTPKEAFKIQVKRPKK